MRTHNVHFQIRCTQEQKDLIRLAASIQGQGMSEFIRDAAMLEARFTLNEAQQKEKVEANV
jgi:uncharacterized protein (DUF1778 family)